MKESERVMLQVLAVARRYHPHIRGDKKGGWSDLAHLLSDPTTKISPQMIGNWRHRKLPERIDFFIAEKIGCTIEELRGIEGAEQELKTIDEETMTPEERMLIAHYRRADAEKQAAVFKIVTGQSKPPSQPSQPAGNVLHFKPHRKK